MEGIIKVSPQLLTNTAAEFSNQGAAVNTLTNEMMTMITGLSATWEGDAATTYISKFKGLEDDIQKMIRMIQEHSTDLEEMSRIYAKSNAENAEEANSLSSDVIV